jgi:hypothetical protein
MVTEAIRRLGRQGSKERDKKAERQADGRRRKEG